MDTSILAAELARRLTETQVARFKAEGDRVVLDGQYDFDIPLRVLDVGSGRPERVRRALEEAAESRDVPVLVGRRLSPGALRHLRDANANYMDERFLHVGLQTPMVFIDQDNGQEVPFARESRISLSGAAGGVALALLLEPHEDWRVTDAAERAGVSLGTSQNVLVALEADGLVKRTGKGPATRRRVVDPGELLDRYALDAAVDRKPMARGFVLNQGVYETVRALAAGLEGSGITWGLTGVGAAALLAPYLTSVGHYEVWVTSPHAPAFALERMGAMAVERGVNLTLLRGPAAVLLGGRMQEDVWLASAVRVYVDLLQDPARGKEQAEHLRDQVIGF
jgi:hypothetical protein